MKKFQNILSSFPKKKIIVIGDIMLDKYIEGDVSRISSEAPVPVVKIEKEFYELGGAGNVASNISALRGDVSIFGFAGQDNEAEILEKALNKKNIYYVLDKNNVTTQKIRVVSKGQQLLRFDYEDIIEKKFSKKTKEIILEKARTADMIVLSDYAKGTINEDLMNLLSPFKRKIIVDPKPKNKSLYKGVFLIKTNEKESKEMIFGRDIEETARALKKEMDANIMITRGNKGIFLYTDRRIEIPTYAREVYDVTGAGDTVISVLALCLACGASVEDAAIMANYAAGIAVEKKGTYAVSLHELERRILSKEIKIMGLDELKNVVFDLKRKGKKIVWTNGYFDRLHVGHTRYLQEAKKLGDVLVVGLNSDISMNKLKEKENHVQSEDERAEIISSLESVDYVVIYSELDAWRCICELKPEIYAKGDNYNIKTINQDERNVVEGYGGEIMFVNILKSGSIKTGV